MVSWKMLNIGQVSRNRYWGEAEEKPLRPGICSSTVLWDSGHVILVDPPREGEEMIRLLDSHTGLKAEQVDTVFVTHGHTDHFEGLGMFPHATWCCGIKEQDRLRALINDVGLDGMRLQGVEKRISPQIEVVGLPGHTVGSAGLLFDTDLGHMLIAGDAVMTQEHYAHQKGYFKSENQEASAKTIHWISEHADAVIPGHDNYFLTFAVKFIKKEIK